MTAPWYAAAGVDLRLGQGVDAVRPGGLALAGGGWLAADEVVTAIGVAPGGGLAGRLRASSSRTAWPWTASCAPSVPGVFAVGDCAAFWSGRYGRRLRFEHWDVALHAPGGGRGQPRSAAARRYDPVPYFWSEQFGRMVQYVGLPRGGRTAWSGGAIRPRGSGPRAGWPAIGWSRC